MKSWPTPARRANRASSVNRAATAKAVVATGIAADVIVIAAHAVTVAVGMIAARGETAAIAVRAGIVRAATTMGRRPSSLPRS